MHGGACRCGTVLRGRGPRRRSSTSVLGLLLAALLLVFPSAAGSAATPSTAHRTAGSVTLVVVGQGRVTSDPAGTIDCPTTCTASFTGSTSLKLRATPAAGHELASWGDRCDRTALECTFELDDFGYTFEISFRPRAQLQVWPAGEGAITLTPPGVARLGKPAETCTSDNASDSLGCERYYLPGTAVTAAASAAAGSTFLGWSTPACAGTGACGVSLTRDAVSLVARFSPLRLELAFVGRGRVVSGPAGIDCPPSCTAPFVPGTRVTLTAEPDPSLPTVRWQGGCTPAAGDPSRCVLVVTNHPHVVGVAVSSDVIFALPPVVAVLFDVTRDGEGAVVGRELDCGGKCEHRYRFGTEEELRAQPAAGWRFTRWRGACATAVTCRLHVGPVTSLGAKFTENLVPTLLSVRSSGRARQRRLTVRLSVRHAAQVRLRLRRTGSARVLADRRYALVKGPNTVALGIPARSGAGRYRLTIAVSDGQGGGRTWHRVRKVGR
jgi:hypothetical protein